MSPGCLSRMDFAKPRYTYHAGDLFVFHDERHTCQRGGLPSCPPLAILVQHPHFVSTSAPSLFHEEMGYHGYEPQPQGDEHAHHHKKR